MTKNKNIKAKTTGLIEPYGMTLWVVIADDINKARRDMNCVFGCKWEDEALALCSWGRGNYGLFYPNRFTSHAEIAHEVFHLAHRLMQERGEEFSNDHHEPFAYLIGWLTEQVYETFRKARLRILPRRYWLSKP